MQLATYGIPHSHCWFSTSSIPMDNYLDFDTTIQNADDSGEPWDVYCTLTLVYPTGIGQPERAHLFYRKELADRAGTVEEWHQEAQLEVKIPLEEAYRLLLVGA